MKIFSRIASAALLVSTPILVAHPTSEILRLIAQQENHSPIRIPDLRTLSYDEVIDLLALIESDSFDDRYSIEELDQINQFISLLAMEGVTNDEKSDMESAVASLFRKDDIQYACLRNVEFGYTATPAIYIEGSQDIVLCKNWFKKQWHQTKSFVKKHKKAIIIGAIVVVTVAVVVVAVVAVSSSAAGAAVAAGGALATADNVTGAPTGIPNVKAEAKSHSESKEMLSSESLASSLQSQISEFKETTAQEQFAAAPEWNGISMEENGRIVGSLFAHKTVDAVTAGFVQNSSLANEWKNLGFHSQYPVPGWLQTCPESSTMMPHPSTDLAFSTDYTATYGTNGSNLNMLSYQARGDLALSSGCFAQAVQDFGSAIAIEPENPILYLERGIANFELGEYEQSIADYTQYIEKKGESFSITDFSIGFAKGAPKGAYESGKGALLFLSEFVTHPVQTSKQMVDSLSQLATLVKNDEFGVVAEALSPELHQLVTQWDTLPSETRGELAGYAVGKLGTDLLAPGAIAKVTSRSVNSAKELAAICKNIQFAQETLILETASGIGVPLKIGEIVKVGKKMANLGEELGFTAQEIGQFQKVGKLETALTKAYEHLTPPMRESFELFDRAQQFLKSYKGFMSEAKAKELIQQAGIKTFPRPTGIPDNYRIKLSNTGAGLKYVHPVDEGTYIRVMPGKPHSTNPCQQKPYINWRINGKSVDKFGNFVENDSPLAHIPLEEWNYKNMK